MRVKMLESLPVTVNGVDTRDLVAGEEYEVGDGIGADLVDAGKAEDVTAPAAELSRGGTRRDTPPAAPPADPPVEASWPSTHAEIDELAAKLEVTFPDPPEGKDRLTIAEKVDALEAAGHTPAEGAEPASEASE